VLLHNLGVTPSEVHIVDKFEGRIIRKIKNIGHEAHGLTFWNDSLVTLDSAGGKLVRIVLATNEKHVLWQCSKQSCFLKGLAIMGGVAYFGMAQKQTARLDRINVNCTLVQVSLLDNTEGAAHHLETRGLLNLIANPRYIASRHYEQISLLNKVTGRSRYVSLGPVDIVAARQFILRHWQDLWANHSYPHLFPGLKTAGLVFQNVSKCQLIFSVNPRALLSFSKPTRESMNNVPWPKSELSRVVFPGWRLMQHVIGPILEEIFHRRLGIERYKSKILRLYMNRMPAYARIAPHQDQGFYAQKAHRYHIPLIVPSDVVFMQVLSSATEENMQETHVHVPMKEGHVFEVNNLLSHYVNKTSIFERVTLVVDLLDEPCDVTLEVDGGNCNTWFDHKCYLNSNVTDAEFWERRNDVTTDKMHDGEVNSSDIFKTMASEYYMGHGHEL